MIPLFIAPPEIVVLLGLFALIIGSRKIPDVGHAFGRATREWKMGNRESHAELEDLREELGNERSEQGSTE